MKEFLSNLMLGLGGRKFLLACASLGVGTYIEVMTTRGITPAFAGLVVAILSAFSVTNNMASKAFLDSKKDVPEDQINSAVDAINGRLDQMAMHASTQAQTVANTQLMLENIIKVAQGIKK